MSKIWSILFGGICAATLLAAGGCQAAGAAAYAGTPPDTIKAQYVLPKAPTLVLVESYGNAGEATLYADQLGVALVRQLKDHQVGQEVDPQLLAKLREDDTEKYDKMTIDGIGRALGAKQVIYVNVIRAELEDPSGSTSARGDIDCIVRVVDAATGETRWPPEASDGQLIQIQTPWLHSDAPIPTRPDVHQDMVQRTADAVAKLFYEWEPDSPIQETPQPAPE